MIRHHGTKVSRHPFLSQNRSLPSISEENILPVRQIRKRSLSLRCCEIELSRLIRHDRCTIGNGGNFAMQRWITSLGVLIDAYADEFATAVILE